jgi:tetratricopeptide (TPR) repeat protein
MNTFLLIACLALPQANGSAVHVRIEREPGGTLCSVVGRNVSAQVALAAVAAELGVELTIASPMSGSEPLTIDLQSRPLEDVLDFIAGSAGMRIERGPGYLSMSVDVPLDTDRNLLLQRSSNAWQLAMKNFPGHDRVAEGLMTLAAIEMARENQVKAREYWSSLVDNRPGSDLVPAAVYAYGMTLEQNGQWREAVEWFTNLANHMAATDFREPAWLELARCQSHLGDARQVHYLMDTLDDEFPVSDANSVADRLLIRARAWNAQQLPVDALRNLDQAERTGADLLDTREFTALRARALELYGMPEAGALAWLGFSLDAEDEDLAQALEEAARLALVSGEEATAILIEAMAEKRGVRDDHISRWANVARETLGLGADTSPSKGTYEMRIATAERWLEEGRADLARQDLTDLIPGMGALDESKRSRTAIAWSRCLAADGAVDGAVNFLRDTVRTLSDLKHRRLIYLAAAKLLEEAGDTKGALNAYRGIL